MAYKKARFVIHYKDGTTYIQDRNNPDSWMNRPRKPIIALAIQPDPELIATAKHDNGKKERVNIKLDNRITLDPIVLKGSFKYNYGFFMDHFMDHNILDLKTKEKIDRKNVYGIRVGMIIDNIGHCVCVEYVGTGMPRIYYTTVKSLGMDANSLSVNYEIKLEELPNPNAKIPMYPERNPLLSRKKE